MQMKKNYNLVQVSSNAMISKGEIWPPIFIQKEKIREFYSCQCSFKWKSWNKFSTMERIDYNEYTRLDSENLLYTKI